ncbi:MAG: ribosome-associated translation inhibitor RaiA [Candidatus Eremiobacteraeota bacterium]|jgi:putative sigma-54 modulation protein|nr:ribosome-associated translation inhibitor RaiA [Candidatus Eremiobacteraeota bacterium]MCL5054849.1 ribosome-associated translation inhibitor RaiA [Bacillota bacterium]
MEITLKSKNFELTGALKDYTKKKLARIEKYLDHIHSADVMLSAEKNRHTVEVTLHTNRAVLRGEEKTENMYSSIDKVMDKLERQVLKLKEKRHDRHHPREVEEQPQETAPALNVRIKKQKIQVSTVEEAVQKAIENKNGFYWFQNQETGEMNLVYQEKNGGVTVLEPVT